MARPAVTFEAPGPGQWALDRSHFPGGTTPIMQWLMGDTMAAGMERVFAEIGVPALRMEARFVEGFMYTRLIPLIGGDRAPRKPPPAAVLKLATRLHPEFRARRKAAAAALADRPFLDVAQDWETRTRPHLASRNREFQAFDLGSAGDPELDEHLGQLLDHVRETNELHFYLHGHDLGPIARYLHAAVGWGLDPTEATEALAGASPSTARPLGRLTRLRAMIDEHGDVVATLDDVRSISAEAAKLVDEHLDDYGAVLATGYDITSFTLGELPGVLLSSIRSATMPSGDDAAALASTLRDQVSPSARTEFDELLADARAVMDMRDDNGPVTVEWPLGLLRRALLEAGTRLTARGALDEPDHVFEASPDEARKLLTGAPPSAEQYAARAAARLAQQRLDPPALLGPDEPEPPLDVMPAPLPDLVAAVQTAITHLGMDGTTPADPMVGVGIGGDAYTGRVSAAASADEAIEKLEPGDVLVVRATSPAYNAVLMVAGAVVTANGGALSHAAVLARELGIPALVGVSGALDIPDGSTVTVDPVAGRVTLVS